MKSRHTEWRKLAKKSRRKRIRQKIAQERDLAEEYDRLKRENSPNFPEKLKTEQNAERLRLQNEQKIHDELEAKWLETEQNAQKEWRELQKKIKDLRNERAIQNVKIKREWEQDKKRLRETEEAKRKETEEEIKRQELIQREINEFIEFGGRIPEHIKIDFQTNPGKSICPFFNKTSACRFGDLCSRNHVRPGISKILLINNFYSHYSLTQTENEHGNSALEYEITEIYTHFKDFFYDVVPEIAKYGEINQIVVCCNAEIHLRGNVYIDFFSEREALIAFKSLNGRWYAGKQLNVQFSSISSWKSAICGLFDRKNCPKGASCNFIHRFPNPRHLYVDDSNRKSTLEKQSHLYRTSKQDWRWSESPEQERDYQSDWEDLLYDNVDTFSGEEIKLSHRAQRTYERRRHSSSSSKHHKRSRSRTEGHERKKGSFREKKDRIKIDIQMHERERKK